jgi:hypothetical protein
MEMLQRNSLCTYVKQKCHFFVYKIGEQEGGIGPAWGGVGNSGRGEEVGKGHRMVKILYSHVYKWKNDTC